MGTSHLYHSLLEQIRQFRPKQHITQLRTQAWFMTGIFLTRSVHLSRIANYIVGPTQRSSKTQRLRRLNTAPCDSWPMGRKSAVVIGC